MSETSNAGRGRSEVHPLWRMLSENPISAFNAAMIFVGGGAVWASNDARMGAMELRVQKIEVAMREDSIASGVKDDRTTVKVEAITRDLNDVKVTVRGIESSVQFLVRQAQGGRAPQP